jgi:hypothetical protein
VGCYHEDQDEVILMAGPNRHEQSKDSLARHSATGHPSIEQLMAEQGKGHFQMSLYCMATSGLKRSPSKSFWKHSTSGVAEHAPTQQRESDSCRYGCCLFPV